MRFVSHRADAVGSRKIKSQHLRVHKFMQGLYQQDESFDVCRTKRQEQHSIPSAAALGKAACFISVL